MEISGEEVIDMFEHAKDNEEVEDTDEITRKILHSDGLKLSSAALAYTGQQEECTHHDILFLLKYDMLRV